MLELPFSRFKAFSSLDAAHIDVSKLNMVFSHVPHFPIYRKRFRGLLKEKSYGRRHQHELLQLLKDLVCLCTRDNLQEAFEHLKTDISGRMGTFEMTPESIRLPETYNEALLQQAMLGQSSFAFAFHVLQLLDQRLREDDRAVKMHEDLGKRLRNLSRLQMETQRKSKGQDQQVISEFIVAHSASLLKDLNAISNLSLSSDVRVSVSKHKHHVGNLLREEMESLDQRISDSLIFLSQLDKLSKSSKVFEEKCRKSLSKMGRELMGIAYLITGAEKTLDDKDVLKGVVMDNVRLNLFFALLLLPYSDGFSGKYQTAVEGRLMLLSHYANYLHEMDFKDVVKAVFPPNCKLSCDGIAKFGSRKVVDVAKWVAHQTQVRDNGATFRWELYQSIELHLRNRIQSRQELEAVISLKKLIVYQMLQQHSVKSMDSLNAIRQALTGEENGEGGMGVYLPQDVVKILREICHCFSQLLNNDPERVKGLYRQHVNPRAYFNLEKLPKSHYRRQTNGVIQRAKGENGEGIGEQLGHLLDVLCESCEKNVDRDLGASQLDKVISSNAPYDGGLLEILDDPKALRKLLENPAIKNQSLNRKKMVQLIQLTRTILSN